MDLVITKKSTLWFGMLDAGAKSSLVVRDLALETGIPTTIYLFNQKRGAIREYQLAIVEKVLRELTAEEQDLIGPLEEAYDSARSGFVPRYNPSTRARSRRQKEVELPEVDDAPDDDDDDSFPPELEDPAEDDAEEDDD